MRLKKRYYKGINLTICRIIYAILNETSFDSQSVITELTFVCHYSHYDINEIGVTRDTRRIIHSRRNVTRSFLERS